MIAEDRRAVLPEYDHVLFARPPLRLVIAQVRFPVLLRFGDSAFLAPFQDAIRAEYPRLSREDQVAFQVSPKGVQQSAGEQQWRFASRDGDWALVLSENALTIESRKYSSDADLLERFARALTAASDHLNVTERVRLGLRYINEFRLDGMFTLADWGIILRPEFVGFAATNLFDGDVERMVQEVRVQQPNGSLDIRHGLLTGTIVDPPPENPPANGRFYFLDLDYYDGSELELDIGGTIDRLREYNHVLYRFFRWTLTEQMFHELEPVNAR